MAKHNRTITTAPQNKINLNKTVPEKKELARNIFRQQLRMTKKDIADLVNAIQVAESIYTPSRERLLEVYKNIELESQMSSLIQTRKLKTLGKDFEIVKKSGKPDEELTQLFQGTWFLDTLSHAWDSIMYGYSLVQVNDIVDGKPSGVELFPRMNVRPETQEVIATPFAPTGINFEDNEYAWFFGRKSDLGLLSKIAVLAIYKQHTNAAWIQLGELFGMPLRIGKVDMTNKERAESMFEMLVNMTSAAAGVMDKDEEVEFIEAAKVTGGGIHESIVKYLDEQISKLIFGQTMMADNGSSRSQSEVHERVGNDYVLADMKLLERMVNDVVIPKMIRIGYSQLINCRFQFIKTKDNSAFCTQVIAAMTAGVPVDMEWFGKTFNIEINKDAAAVTAVGSATEQDGKSAKKDGSAGK